MNGVTVPPHHRITVTGRATRLVTPDIASWSAATEGKGDTQRQAFADCSSKLAALLAAVAETAAKDARVSASGVYVSPEWDERGRKRIGFVAGGSVTIRAGLEEAGRLGQLALDAGAVRLDGPGYEVADADAIQDELRAEAVVAARATAERMAAAAGRTLGAAIRISDQGTDGGMGWAPQAKFSRAGAMEMSADAPPLEPDSQEIQASATVSFELRD
jgi:uncharacterized protein